MEPGYDLNLYAIREIEDEATCGGNLFLMLDFLGGCTMRKWLRVVVAAAFVLAAVGGDSYAGGKGGRSSSSGSSRSSGARSSGVRSAPRSSPGTGSRSSGTSVRGYTRSNGTRVESHQRSSADGNFRNNYSTRGNTNPSTGKAGTRVTPPKK